MRYALENCTKTISPDGLTIDMEGDSIEGRSFKVSVKVADLNRWLAGGYIQDCFPYLSASEREVCMSGVDDEQWDEIFAED